MAPVVRILLQCRRQEIDHYVDPAGGREYVLSVLTRRISGQKAWRATARGAIKWDMTEHIVNHYLSYHLAALPSLNTGIFVPKYSEPS